LEHSRTVHRKQRLLKGIMKIGVDKLEGEEPLLLMTDIVIPRPNAMIKKYNY